MYRQMAEADIKNSSIILHFGKYQNLMILKLSKRHF